MAAVSCRQTSYMYKHSTNDSQIVAVVSEHSSVAPTYLRTVTVSAAAATTADWRRPAS